MCEGRCGRDWLPEPVRGTAQIWGWDGSCGGEGGLGLKRTFPLEGSTVVAAHRGPSDPGRRCAGRGESPLDTFFPKLLRVSCVWWGHVVLATGGWGPRRPRSLKR